MKANFAQPSKELSLLALCAEKELTPWHIEMIRKLISDAISWDRFLALAINNRVLPIAFKNLSGSHVSNIDPEKIKIMKGLCIQSQTDSLRLTAELIRVMSILELAGIKALSLKGPILGLLLYQDLSLRPSRDLDILIDRSDLQKAEDILIDAGYQKEPLWRGLSVKQREYITAANYLRHLSFINSTGVIIELHWAYCAGFCSIPFEEVWSSRIEYGLGTQKIHVLNFEENLLYLVYHGSAHAWKRLRWLCDVHELIQKDEIDWVSVMEKAQARRIMHLLAQALHLTSLIFGDSHPEEIMKRLPNDKRTPRLVSMAVTFLEDTNEKVEQAGQPLCRFYRKYKNIWEYNLFSRIKANMMRFRPGAPEFQALRVSDRLFFLYYLFRPIYKCLRCIKDRLEKPPERQEHRPL